MFTKIFKHGKIYKISNVFLNKKKAIYIMKKALGNRKAMTVLRAAILTGIGIAIALIVGYWIWPLTVGVGSIRIVERLYISIPYAKFYSGLNKWEVSIKVVNKGPNDSTIVDIMINGKSYTDWNGVKVNIELPYHLSPGGEVTVIITLPKSSFTAKQTVELSFVTAANCIYTTSVSLP